MGRRGQAGGNMQGGWGELDEARFGRIRAERCRWLVEWVGLSDVALVIRL